MPASLRELLRAGAARLADAGIGAAAWDAELLLRRVLGWDRAQLLAAQDEPAADDARARFDALIVGRAQRQPLQYLVGVQAFWRHDFLVTPDVLIPRPSTEHLVEAALEYLRDVPTPRLIDVGTGSGCIALSLAAERPDAQVDAVDLSPAALEVAARNAARLGVAARVRFQQGDLLAPYAHEPGCFDGVLSNPPYVDPADAPSLEPEVREHEPHLALFAPGPGPYGVFERLLPAAFDALRPGGFVALEVGQDMDERVAALARAHGFELLECRADLAGIPRVVLARKARAAGRGPA